ncbi:MAG: CPBP family intramembrane metalloprotease [Sorangiineae bacterium]|nr:CPBP family intramembrane metalloprotease [Polyangiaceae bacterium]MEB2324956.1 CPBP family intramembrane metalloprotease [Sorangiineae bacterium]
MALAAAGFLGAKPADLLGDSAGPPPASAPVWLSLATLANEAAIAAVMLGYLRFARPRRAEVCPLGRPTARGLLGALAVVFGAAPWADAAARWVHGLTRNDVTASLVVARAAAAATPATLALLLFSVAVVPALVEEAMFRGLLTAPFLRRSTAQALVVPSLLFGLFHLEPTQVAGTALLGLAFALARLTTGSLIPGVLAHAVYNAAVVLSVRSSPPRLDPSIEPAPLVAGALLAALGVWLLVGARDGGRASDPRRPRC